MNPDCEFGGSFRILMIFSNFRHLFEFDQPHRRDFLRFPTVGGWTTFGSEAMDLIAGGGKDLGSCVVNSTTTRFELRSA